MTDLRAKPGRLVAITVVRAVATTTVLLTLYYTLPLDGDGTDLSTGAALALGLVLLVGIMAWNVRLIGRSANPAVSALEGLVLGLSLFLLMFAATYYVMSESDAGTFTSELSRTDALYFTTTTFATVGFGDITAQTQTARLVVSAQMVLDLVFLGVGVRVIVGVVQRTRSRLADDAPDSAPLP